MSKQKIQLSDHFTYPRLLRFVLPAVGTMLFTSIYGIVDGLCVSNFVGSLREDPKLTAERQQVEAEALHNYRDKLEDIAMN